jgi:hypothetical protein
VLLDVVGDLEEGLDAADDFVLFFQWGSRPNISSSASAV